MALFTIAEPGQGKHRTKPGRKRAVGIDLGTTNSLVAVAREGKAVTLPDAEGNYLAQADYGLRGLGFGWQMGVIPTADLAEDGDYELTATIYNWRSGETVEGVLAATGETGDILPVAILVPGRDNVQAG